MIKITKTQFAKFQKRRMTDAAIAEELGVTRQAVYQMRRKLGLKSTSASGNRDRNEEIVKAYNAGMPGTAIAKKLGMSVTHTYRIINAAKAKTKKAEKKAVAKIVKKAAKKKTVAVKEFSAPVKKKSTAKKRSVKKTPTKKASVKKTSVKKSPVKKVSAKKAPVKKSPVKKVSAKKLPVKKKAVKKTTRKKR
ncbi:MAG: hypothetical protein LBC70_09310 [Chitinispirillales bacterium]|jgi:hypothetical protein|nr:hypothetical protein [Chitinispirillales bacterium]